MEIIKIKAYQYNELNEESKFKVKKWLNYMKDKEIQEYCEHEEFLFSESGSRIDFLKTKVRISK